MVYLIMGLTGAGKTTYARQLAQREKGLRFSIDDMMKVLFVPDQPPSPTFEWYMERILRCEDLAWALGEQALAASMPVVMDLGFTTRADRDRILSRCRERGESAEIHFLDVPRDTRWHHVEKRNREKGLTYAMTVTREMFDFMENLFEAPSPEEERILKRIGI